MAYKLEYLPLSVADILQTEAGLYEFSPAAADKFSDEIIQLEDALCEHPFMYRVYEDDDFYRTVNLSYSYRLFYHINELTKKVEVHRVLHGMRNLNELL